MRLAPALAALAALLTSHPARAGQEVRFHVLQPGGHSRGHVFQLHGHGWDELPYAYGSSVIGHNSDSEYKGSQAGHGPSNHFDCVMTAAAFPGDFLYRDQASFLFDGGLWGIFRVSP